MKKLFLASDFAGVSKLFPDFMNNEHVGKKVVFIPTASLPEKVKFYVGSDRKAFEKLGMVVDDLEVSSVSKDEVTGRISDADYIHVTGGNTFFLLQELRRSGADALIVDHINKGKVYIGASAGSMILAKDIEYVKHMDNPTAAPDLHEDYRALGITDFCVVPHYTNFPFKKAAEKIVAAYSDKLNLCVISNNQAVMVTGDQYHVVTAEK